jgi:hypothetical protein
MSPIVKRHPIITTNKKQLRIFCISPDMSGMAAMTASISSDFRVVLATGTKYTVNREITVKNRLPYTS